MDQISRLGPLGMPESETLGVVVRVKDEGENNEFANFPTLIGGPVTMNTMAYMDYSNIITFDKFEAPAMSFWQYGESGVMPLPTFYSELEAQGIPDPGEPDEDDGTPTVGGSPSKGYRYIIPQMSFENGAISVIGADVVSPGYRFLFDTGGPRVLIGQRLANALNIDLNSPEPGINPVEFQIDEDTTLYANPYRISFIVIPSMDNNNEYRVFSPLVFVYPEPFFKGVDANVGMSLFWNTQLLFDPCSDPPRLGFFHGSCNQPPVCDPNGPYGFECGEDVPLDGTGSSDPDDDQLMYSWTGSFAGGSAGGSTPSVIFQETGQSEVTLIVDDEKGGTAECTSPVNVVDTKPPSLTPPEDKTAECTSPAGASVALGTPDAEDLCDNQVTVTKNAQAVYPIGKTTVNWTATDDSGNKSTAHHIVTVVDTTPPLLTAPEDKLEECTSPEGTPVNLGFAEASDVCDDNVTVANDAPSAFSLGLATVTWTATDDSDNLSSATQTVTIEDTTPPKFSLKVSPAELRPPNHKMVPVTVTAEVQDICDPEPVCPNCLR